MEGVTVLPCTDCILHHKPLFKQLDLNVYVLICHIFVTLKKADMHS